MEINAVWTRDPVKKEPFDQDDQLGCHRSWIEVSTKCSLVHPIRNKLLEIPMPFIIQLLERRLKRGISQRTKDEFAQRNEQLRLCLETITGPQKQGMDLVQWCGFTHLAER